MILEYAKLLQKHGLKVILSGPAGNDIKAIFGVKNDITASASPRLGDKVRNQMLDVLANRRKVMTTPCSSLVQLEDLLELTCGNDRFLRQFHCIIFFDDTKVSLVLELAGIDDDKCQWIQSFGRDQSGVLRFNDSKWVRQLSEKAAITKTLLGELNEQ
jgi:hypothetical protein